MVRVPHRYWCGVTVAGKSDTRPSWGSKDADNTSKELLDRLEQPGGSRPGSEVGGSVFGAVCKTSWRE